MPILELKNIKRIYESKNIKTEALRDVNLSVDEGEFISIMGESGAGDSDIMMTDTINPLKSKFKASTKLLNKTI